MNLRNVTINQVVAMILIAGNIIALGTIIFVPSTTNTRIIIGIMVLANFFLAYRSWFNLAADSLQNRILASIMLFLIFIVSGSYFLGFL